MDRPETPKPYSCVICHKRKVKCDRQEPCSNCSKANAECVYRPPPPPRRRKRERADSGDALLDLDQSIRRGAKELPQNHAAKQASTKDLLADPSQRGHSSGRMIMKQGNSIYLDSTLWTRVSQELPDATHVLDNASDHESDDLSDEELDETLMILAPGAENSRAGLHPNPVHIFKLWQTFLENVNPLIKILHTPTVQPQILDAMVDHEKMSRDLEALMFSMYCISLISLTAEEVAESFGESKKNLLRRFRKGAQFAFRNTSLLRTSSFMVLQAFILYILSLRAVSDPSSVWTLSGIAMRIAQRIGIHRDGAGYGLSPFDTEIRRRVWFQLVILDATSAQSCGVASSPMLPTSDSRPPANVNDSDLDPLMKQPPSEKDGVTDMMFCLARSEFGKWLRRWSAADGSDPSNSPWASLASSSMSSRGKDEAVKELESLLEEKYLKYCDPSIPLHSVTIMMARSAILYTRLMIHHPGNTKAQILGSRKLKET
ncbi:hypothetical protein N7470_005011 [Penicillium chermesinum]|nr:hypothetical protein N7470_005011 [Penicillium chermesinum]